MIITCANCDTSYELNENLIKETGSKVRCKNCNQVFTVFPPQTLDSIEPEPDLELEMVVDEPEASKAAEAPPAEAEADVPEEDEASLDLPDFEEVLDAEAGAAAEDQGVSEAEPDLSLAMDMDEEPVAEVSKAAEAADNAETAAAGDNLDFLDLSDIEDMLVTDIEADPDSLKAGEDEPELELEMTPEAAETAETGGTSEEEVAKPVSEGIDLSEIEELLDVEKDVTLEDLEKAGKEQELELAPEPGFDPITGVAEDLLPDDTDALDLSDIEKMLDTEVAGGPESVKITEEEPELSLEPEAPEDDVIPEFSSEADEDSLELDLELELEAEDTAGAGDEISEELILDEEELTLDTEDAEELVLDEEELTLDTEDAEELVLDEEELTLDTEDAEELVLDEEELMLDAEDTEELTLDLEMEDSALLLEADEDEALDLDMEDAELSLDLEESLELEADETPVAEEDLQLDIEGDLELELEADDDLLLEPDEAEGELFLEPDDTSDAELTLEPEEDDLLELDLEAEPDMAEASEEADFELDLDELEDAAETEAATPAIAEKAEAAAEAFALGGDEDTKAAAQPVPPHAAQAPKKKSRALTYILIFLLLICGGGYGGLTYLKQKGIEPTELPYIKTLFAKSGEVVAIETTLKYDFYENAQVGPLLVITGDVENKFDHGRSYIRVTGEVLSSSQKVIKSETAYCGNVLDKSILENENFSRIKARMQKRTGNKNVNVNVKAGAKIPFMVVFSNLPENIREFRVKVSGSEAAGK